MQTTDTARKPLRLWPAVAIATLMLAGFLTPVILPRYAGLAMLGAAVGALLIILWWLLFSRARWYERVGGLVLIVAAAFAEKFVVHPSIAGGAMGNMTYLLVVQTLAVALVAWAAGSPPPPPGGPAAAPRAPVVLRCFPRAPPRPGGQGAHGPPGFPRRWAMK